MEDQNEKFSRKVTGKNRETENIEKKKLKLRNMNDKSKSTHILITGSQRDGVEKIFFKIMKINIPGLMNDRILQNEKVLRGPNRRDKKKIHTYSHYNRSI